MVSKRSRNIERGLETRGAILSAATKLFGNLGYEAVTMRQIAAEAGCSHTAIYLYFQDKAQLLDAIALPALEELRKRFLAIRAGVSKSEEKLFRTCEDFLHFCLDRRGTYRVVFATAAARVDSTQEEGTVNRVRLGIFALLTETVAEALDLKSEDARLTASRIYFYLLQGIASTYDQSQESTEALWTRLRQTFDTAIRALWIGLKEEFKQRNS